MTATCVLPTSCRLAQTLWILLYLTIRLIILALTHLYAMNAVSSSSTTTSTEIEELSLHERLQLRRDNYAALPQELVPASRPSSPSGDGRVAELKAAVTALMEVAGGDTTNPKWGYLTRKTTLACTSRRYVTAAQRVRVGDKHGAARVGKRFKWELPETEGEWEAYERRWETAISEEAERKNRKASAKRSKSPSKVTRTSKYFDQPAAESSQPEALPRDKTAAEQERALEPEAEQHKTGTRHKAKTIQEKVERWQAQVVTVPNIENLPNTQVSLDPSQSPKVDKGKAKEALSQGDKVQTSLSFRVVKRSSVQSAKGDSAASSKPSKQSPPIPALTPSRDELPAVAAVPAPLPRPIQPASSAPARDPTDVAPAPRITDLAEQASLPTFWMNA